MLLILVFGFTISIKKYLHILRTIMLNGGKSYCIIKEIVIFRKINLFRSLHYNIYIYIYITIFRELIPKETLIYLIFFLILRPSYYCIKIASNKIRERYT